ncbi:protein tyrosine phosphatase, partial [Klebsiella pneumoniae]|uniref:arsenate reductase/protein-tyrosine-phosphatase family protein n=1 Tax=Klebsiella pneumoniae TaxID=573 RepID=UPI00274B9BAA|nr:protein tyrosine phosphatase [Klebsiella pneumoniae]
MTVRRLLFFCMGNICRSPTAEAVMRAKLAAAGIDVEVDSAGTHGYHVGEPPDERSQAHAARRG